MQTFTLQSLKGHCHNSNKIDEIGMPISIHHAGILKRIRVLHR